MVVEWDMQADFLGNTGAPSKGIEYHSVSEMRTEEFTIDNLAANTVYYVRVFAKNAVGHSLACNKVGSAGGLCDGVVLRLCPTGSGVAGACGANGVPN